MPSKYHSKKSALAAIDITDLVNRCSGAIRAALMDDEISKLDKAKISVPIMTKHMVNKIEGDIKTDTVLTFSWGQPDGKSN